MPVSVDPQHRKCVVVPACVRQTQIVWKCVVVKASARQAQRLRKRVVVNVNVSVRWERANHAQFNGYDERECTVVRHLDCVQ